MTISGFQVVDIKTSDSVVLQKAYLTAVIEVQGCKFAACVEVLPRIDQDPYQDAQARAIANALDQSKQSDFKLYGKSAGGSYGNRGGSGGQRQQDPNTQASEKQMGRLFAIMNQSGVKPDSVRKTIKDRGWSEPLTVGQIDELLAELEQKKKERVRS